MRTPSAVAAAVLMLAPVPALAQGRTAPCAGPAYRQFDFWIGSWRVTDPDGKFLGTNNVVRAPAGCAIEEHWTGAKGGRGDSFNVYDPFKANWTQLWSGRANVIRLQGQLDRKGAMRLEGTVTDRGDLSTRPIRGVWTPQADGTVRQEFQEFDPMMRVWSTTFVGIYHKTRYPPLAPLNGPG